ncbi:MAG TPA: hypothetical protein VF745_15645 [Steroidobacteraceae bacterium]
MTTAAPTLAPTILYGVSTITPSPDDDPADHEAGNESENDPRRR